MILMALLFLSGFGLLNLYVFANGWFYCFASTALPLSVYSIICLFLAGSYFLGMALKQKWINWIGSIWLAAIIYLFIFSLGLNLYSLLALRTGWNPVAPWIYPAASLIIAGFLLYGAWNAANPRLVNYELEIPGDCPPLNLVAVSDLHLGMLNSLSVYERLVEEINKQQPDLVLFLGDVIDSRLDDAYAKEFAAISRKLQSTYGVYGILGNHERYVGSNSTVLPYFAAGNINMLVDSLISPCPGLYLAGVLSYMHDRKESMTPLTEILAAKPDNGWPVILLNHVPDRLPEARENGIFLMLSGHTHQGQLFPGNLITSWIFENSYGHLFREGLHSIVSSGYGTWGPPIRTGSRGELLQIKLVHSN